MRNSLVRLWRLAAAAGLQCAGSGRCFRLRDGLWPAGPERRAAGPSARQAPPRLIDVRLGSLDLALRRQGWFAMARGRE